MTQPITITSKAKAYVALAGTLLTFVVPYLLQYADLLPAPWPDIIRGVLGVLTVIGVYQVPNKLPPGAVVAPANPSQPAPPASSPPGDYTQNPW